MIVLDSTNTTLVGTTVVYRVEIIDSISALVQLVDSFTVTYSYDCNPAVFDPFSGVTTLTHEYLGATSTLDNPIPSDTLGTAANDLLLCGSRQFALTDPVSGLQPNWLSITQDEILGTFTLAVDTTNEAEAVIGLYTINAAVSIVGQTTTPLQITISVEIVCPQGPTQY